MDRRNDILDSLAFARALEAARGGKKEAFGSLLESTRHWLQRLARRELVRDRSAKTSPSDCVQETFLEAHRAFATFKGTQRGEFLCWLRRILTHNLADYRRRYATRIRDVSRELPLSQVHPVPALVSREQPPGDSLQAEEQIQNLRTAVSDLPRDYRTVIHLRHDHGHSFAHIARVMGKPSQDAARKLWERALRTLRETIRDDHAVRPKPPVQFSESP